MLNPMKWPALVSLLLASCNAPNRETKAVPDFLPGEWTRSEPFGDHQTSLISWTFRKDGTLTREGYPAFFAEARYEVRSADTTAATLALRDRTGPQSDALPDEMVVQLNPKTATLSVDGSPPLTRQRTAAIHPAQGGQGRR